MTEPRKKAPFTSALWPGVLLCTVAAVMAFTLSFTALRAVGIASGIAENQAWMFPLTIDTVILFGTWAAFRFRARGAAGTWYAWVLLSVFAGASWVGNFLHAQPVPVGHLVLSRGVASLFSSVPSLSLLLTTHMLVLIAVRRGEERDARRDRAPAPNTVSVNAVADVRADHSPAITTPRVHLLAAQGHDQITAPTAPGELADSGPAPNSSAGEDARREAGVDDVRLKALADWVAERRAAGEPVRGKDVAEAGLAGTASTGRRRLQTLRQLEPDLFPGGAR